MYQVIKRNNRMVIVHNVVRKTGLRVDNQHINTQLGLNLGINGPLMGNYQSSTSHVQWLKVQNIL